MVPGSAEDMDQYLRARAIDELTVLLDTIDSQAELAKANRTAQENI